jgi:hypothetical protein
MDHTLVELAVPRAAASPNGFSKVSREAPEFYKIDVLAVTTKVEQEFATKDKAKVAKVTTGWRCAIEAAIIG